MGVSFILKRVILLVALIWIPVTWAQVPTVLVVGDSLSAGLGIDVREGWVALLQQKLHQGGYPHQIINASISGDTSAGALARLPRALKLHQPAVVIIEIGGNDGLQGLPLDAMKSNLERIVRLAQQAGARVLVLGMRLPPNYGPAYTERFYASYRMVARRTGVPLVPFFLEGVAGDPALMQTDGVHPKVDAQARMVANVWPYLLPLLR
jgi:acyl-CoA thioesterase-1